MNIARPVSLSPCAATIPESLKVLDRWVVWRFESRGARWTKVPKTPLGAPVSTTDQSTWSDFATAWAAYEEGDVDGIGFVFREEDGFVGWDFDAKDCDRLPADIESAARSLNSYTEVSPGGVGLHVIVRAKLTGERNRVGPYEVYSKARYFTITGHRLEDTPDCIESRQSEHDALYAQVFSKAPVAVQTPMETYTPQLDIETPLTELVNGEITKYGGDHSAADFALCKELYRRGLMDAEVVALWKCSALNRAKTDRLDYVESTLRRAREDLQRESSDAQPQLGMEPVGVSCLTVAPPEPQAIVEGLLPMAPWALVGAGGGGKTTVCLRMLMEVITGRPVFGQFVVTRSGPCVFVTREDSREELKHRIHHIAAGLDLDADERVRIAKGLCILNLIDSSERLVASTAGGNLVFRQLVDRFIAQAKSIAPALVVFDPAVYFGPGEHYVNDGEAMLMQALRKISTALNCSTGALHHTGKAVMRDGTVDQYTGRGGSAFSDNARAVMQLVTHKDNKATKCFVPPPAVTQDAINEERVMRLHQTKFNYGARWQEPLWIVRDRFSPWRFEVYPGISMRGSGEPVRSQADLDHEMKICRDIYEWVATEITEGRYPTLRSCRENVRCYLGGNKVGNAKIEAHAKRSVELGFLEMADVPPEHRRAAKREYLTTVKEPFIGEGGLQ